MAQLAVDDVGEDLHVAVRVHAKAATGADAVFVDDPEVAKAHVARVVVIGEGKGVMGVEPAVVGMAALAGGPEDDHGLNSRLIGCGKEKKVASVL
jgi:hypothetical protein